MAKNDSHLRTPQAWLFDVDGTLTPPRGDMAPEFAQWMTQFAQEHEVCLVSGGTWQRIERQCGPTLAHAVRTAYLCNGNEARVNGATEYTRQAVLPPLLQDALAHLLKQPLPLTQAPPVLEHRPGMVTVSGISTSATPAQRAAFEQWDAQTGWRRSCAQWLESTCPQWRCQIAGQTSLDLFELGADKSQVLEHEGSGPLWFFADAVHPQGNDWTLAQALKARNDGSRVFAVRDWRHTWEILRVLTQSQALLGPAALQPNTANSMLELHGAYADHCLHDSLAR